MRGFILALTVAAGCAPPSSPEGQADLRGLRTGDTAGAELAIDDLVEGDLVISEVMANPDQVLDWRGEWFEVFNASGGSVDLAGLEVFDTSEAVQGEAFSITSGFVLDAGDYAVIASRDTDNGGVPADLTWSGHYLRNGSDSLFLYNGSTVLDTVAWDDGATFPDSAGYSMSLDTSALDSASNDEGAAWCNATSTYGDGDHGTPGAANDGCGSCEDADGDGYEDAACGGDDCNDDNRWRNPDTDWYADADGDGYGDLADSLVQCEAPGGYVRNASDCDDTDAALTLTCETCADADGDGYEDAACGGDDCNDENYWRNPETDWYADADGDGYGDPADVLLQCDFPTGYVRNADDCNDGNVWRNPDTEWFADADGDGYGDAASTLVQCDWPSGYVRDASDCDDTDAALAEDCTGCGDDDGDGYDDEACGGDDCDDANAAVNPGASEGSTADGVDQDCNGWEDDVTVCATGGTWSTIQDGVDNAATGFTVVVCAGTYTEEVVVPDADLWLVSEAGSAGTTIDADGSGRAITLSAGSLTLEGFTLTGGDTDDGGGLACDGASLELVDVAAHDNTVSGDGGGLHAADCVLDVAGSSFTDNTGTAGGGLYAYGGSGVISDSLFSGNRAREEGGGAWITASHELTGNTFDDNEADEPSESGYGPGSGGGGLLYYGSGDITDNTFSNNTSDYHGGGAYVIGHSGLIDGNTFDSNVIYEDGAGFYCNQCSGTFSNNLVTDNDAGDDGGGVRIFVSNMVITDNTFDSNVCGDDGGGLKMSHDANYVADNTFTGNDAGDAGGAVELDNDATPITGNTFTNNTAYNGGAIHSWLNEDVMTWSDNVFDQNTSTGCGGAIGIDNDPYTVTITTSTFTDNHGRDGGAICVADAPYDSYGNQYTSFVAITNSVFTGNTCTSEGGAMDLAAAEVTVANVVGHANDCADGAFLTIDNGGVVEVVNTIATSNLGGAAYDYEGGTLTVTYGNVYGNDEDFHSMTDATGTSGNVAVDPDFVDAEGGDFRLASTSALIDAGDPSVLDVDGSTSDMGAYGGPLGGW